VLTAAWWVARSPDPRCCFSITSAKHLVPSGSHPLPDGRSMEPQLRSLHRNFGAPRHPAWFYNLLANPTTVAEINSDTWSTHARVAVQNERRLLLERIRSATPSAAAAIRNTPREIPVVVLDLLGRLDERSG
jgi:deazaflavin-dependent oxidoreductase (nitroreductase family)